VVFVDEDSILMGYDVASLGNRMPFGGGGMQLRDDAQPCPIKSDCVILPLCYTSHLMSHGETNRSAIHTKHTNKLCGHNLEFFNFKLGGTYSNVPSCKRRINSSSISYTAFYCSASK